MKPVGEVLTSAFLSGHLQTEQNNSLSNGNRSVVPRQANNITLGGYIATDPQVMGKDRNAARFRIRYDKSRKKGDTWEKEANFFSVIAFGAENAEKISGMKKGEEAIVTGSLRQNQKEDKEYVDIIADTVALVNPEGRKNDPKPENDEDWLS
jgi:single-stranded DNA-binding protein